MGHVKFGRKAQGPAQAAVIAGLVIAAAIPALATAAEPFMPKTDPPVHGEWLRIPSGEDLVRFYPQGAREKHLPGASSMECAVTRAGLLTACAVLEETPPGMGFGGAILHLAPKYRMGRPTDEIHDGQKVTVVVHWRLGG
jgi:protein TonB